MDIIKVKWQIQKAQDFCAIVDDGLISEDVLQEVFNEHFSAFDYFCFSISKPMIAKDFGSVYFGEVFPNDVIKMDHL